MVPNFALSLSFEGIALLRKTGDAWAQIQEVSLESGDLDAAILGLRDRAEGLEPTGAQVALVIPNEQIRYIDVRDPGNDGAARDVAARMALDGATPYAVSDLVYDCTAQNGRLLIAAVAKETLAEAEGFAQQNGFEPVSHMAIAPDGQFLGAVFFGACSSWSGRMVSRPDQPIRIVPATDADLIPAATAEAPSNPEVAPPATPIVEPQPEPVLETPEPPRQPGAAAQQAEPDQTPGPEATPEPEPVSDALPDDTAALTEETKPDSLAEQAPPQDLSPPAQEPQITDAPHPPSAPTETVTETETDEDAEPQPAPAFSTIRASRSTTPTGQSPDTARPPEAAESATQKIKPRFTPVATREAPEHNAGAPRKKLVAEPTAAPNSHQTAPKVALDDPAATAKPASVLARMAALRARAGDSEAGEDTGPSSPKVEAPKLKAKPTDKPKADKPKKPAKPKFQPLRKPPTDPPAAPEPTNLATDADEETFAQVVAGQILEEHTAASPIASLEEPGPAADQADQEDSLDQAKATAEAERQRMTVFGARNQPKIGGKPRYLGLLLTIGLLLFMAGVAAWAAVFLDDGLVGLFRSAPEENRLVEAPEILDETGAQDAPKVASPAPSPDPASGAPETDVQLAALEGAQTADMPADPKPLAAPLAAQMLTPEEAAATYAATGIWQRAPLPPHDLTPDGIDEIYVASLDPNIQQFDAIALPNPSDLAQEPALALPRLPPAAGQVFDMDARGLVRATPEGAISPDGVRVFTGRPPVVPPDRLAVAQPQEPAIAPTVDTTLGKFRPRQRPENLLEQRERATLGGNSRSELAAIRPVMRPKTAQEAAIEAEPDAPATALAVDQSLSPVGRPRNMAAIVKRTETAPRAAVETAAVAPRTVQPAGPSSRGVAQSATVRNALNLSKINLIGVYGTPSNRRALVRLSNGKYKKVKIGDRLDGGRVAAIGESELRYTKSGRNVTLKMPRS